MSRYIDADELLKKNMYGNANPIVYRTYAENLIKSAPTADVVPNSEVEQIKAENEDLNIYLKNYKTRNKELQKANEGLAKQCEQLEAELDQAHNIRTGVARDIFGDITNLLLSLVYLGADGKWHTGKKYASELHSFMEGYLELQMKYTEK